VIAESDKLIYGAFNQAVFNAVPKNARRVLDLGCGDGSLGRALKRTGVTEVVGVTYSKAESERAKYLDQVVLADLNEFDPTGLEGFDCVICSHVLEHLYQPQDLLKKLTRVLTPEGRLIVALPNVLYWRQRLKFLAGNFRYTSGGLMDETHFRFYDWKASRNLFRETGFTVVSAEADGGFPLSRYSLVFRDFLDGMAVRLAPGLFGFQFVIVAEPSID
jgi:SAM-dependent methyltransferase